MINPSIFIIFKCLNTNKIMKKQFIPILLICVLIISSCAPQVHSIVKNENTCGFWMGIWHGAICPITFIISLFNDNVAVWETNNNGGWYAFGFLCGSGILFSSGSSSVKQ